MNSRFMDTAGFWKSPAGTDITSNKPIFPDLNVLGASLRG